MVYYKVVLDDRKPTKHNYYPVVVRITNNRKTTTCTTGVRIKKEHWKEEGYQVKPENSNHQALNKKILEFYLKVQKICLELEGGNTFSFDNLKEGLNGKSTKPTVTVLFKPFTEQVIADMISINKTGNAIIYQTTTNRFMGYVNNPKIKFTDINYTLLEGFNRKLITEGMKQNTISNYFRTLRAIYNKAIKAKVIDRSHYPFLDISIKTERTAKRAISVGDLIKIAKLELKPKSREWHARNYFLISFVFTGASFTDLAYLTPNNIKKGRLIYKRRKTGKELSIKINPITEKLLSYYQEMNPKYLLPIVSTNVVEDSMRAKRLISQWIKTTNKWLSNIAKGCNIEDEVTTYVARHTWATTAKRLGYSIELIAEAMGHEHGNKITNIYLDNFDQSLIDEMNEKVISLIR